LADGGYEGAGHGVHTPYKQPADSHQLALDHRAYNMLLRSLTTLHRRTRVRPHDPPLAGYATHHRMPPQDQRHR
jgi:hypothetical protein